MINKDEMLVLFLHGMIGTARHWDGIRRRLPREIQPHCHAMDLDFTAQGAGALTSSLRQRILQNRPRRLILVGNSLGCVLALGLQDLADGLLLTAPPYDFSNEPLRLRREGVAHYIDQLYENGPHIDDFSRHHRDAVRILSTLMASRGGIRALRTMKQDCLEVLNDGSLMRAGAKVHCLIGARDFTTPPKAFARFLATAAPCATLQVVPGCGHAMPLEAPEAVTQALINITAKVPQHA